MVREKKTGKCKRTTLRYTDLVSTYSTCTRNVHVSGINTCTFIYKYSDIYGIAAQSIYWVGYLFCEFTGIINNYCKLILKLYYIFN